MAFRHGWAQIESLCGTGTVYYGQQPIATVQDRLEVRPPMPGTRSVRGSHVRDRPDRIEDAAVASRSQEDQR